MVFFAVIDCGIPPTLENGVVTVSTTGLNGLAFYRCNDGYTIGPYRSVSVRICQVNEVWSGSPPSCGESIDRCLTPVHGFAIVEVSVITQEPF